MIATTAVPACTGPQSATVCGVLLRAKKEIMIREKGERGRRVKRRVKVSLFIYRYMFLASLTLFNDNY